MGCCNIKTPRISLKSAPTPIITSPSRMMQKYSIDPCIFSENYRILNKTRVNPNYELWECSHLYSGNMRTVKVYSKAIFQDENVFAETIMNEIEIMYLLDHPNIIKVLQVIEDRDSVYIVMEFFKLSLLFEEIYKSDQLDNNKILEVTRQLLSILNYCHSQNIILRNFSPESIILEKTNDSFLLKYIDFSYAQLEERDSLAIPELSLFSSPEFPRHTAKADMWSLGVLLHILFTGEPPVFPLSFSESAYPEDLSFTSLLFSLLEQSEDQRFSAKEAIEHISQRRFFKGKVRHAVIVTVLNNMRNYQSTQRLKDMLKTFIAQQLLPLQQTYHARITFMSLDKDADGRLSRSDIEEGLMQVMPRWQAEGEANKILSEIDSDQNGFIEFSEYLKACLSPDALLNKHNLLCAFRMIDENGDGVLQQEELLDALKAEGDLELWKDLLGQMDENGDGTIDLEEFTIFLLGKI